MATVCTTTDNMPELDSVMPECATLQSTKNTDACKPMLAKPIKTRDFAKKLGDCDEWLVEEKFDGERLLITHTTEDSRQLKQSRFLKDIGLAFQHRVDLKPSGNWHHCVFDGELVYRDTDNHAIVSMCETGNRVVNLYSTYIIFDIQCCNGEDVRERPLIERKRLLERIVKKSQYVQLSEWRSIADWQSVVEQFDDVCARGGEGLMLKRKNESYHTNKRKWIKVKPLHLEGVRQDYELFAHQLMRDKNGIFNVINCGYYKDFEDNTSFVKVCGVSSGINGFTRNSLQQLIDSHGFFRERQIVTILADKITLYGHLRHPVFSRLRFDIGESARSVNEKLINLSSTVYKAKHN